MGVLGGEGRPLLAHSARGGYKRLNGPLNKTVEQKLKGVFRCTKTNEITVGQLLRTVLFIAKFIARTTRFPKMFLCLRVFLYQWTPNFCTPRYFCYFWRISFVTPGPNFLYPHTFLLPPNPIFCTPQCFCYCRTLFLLLVTPFFFVTTHFDHNCVDSSG